MKSRTTRNIFAPLIAALMLGLSMGASAVPINGAIGFGGAFAPTGGTDISDATGINFLTAFVLGGTGTYAGIPDFTGASFTDFQFNPLSPAPVSPLWTVSHGGIDYSFNLGAIDIDLQNSQFLNLSGTGWLMATGFDATPGSWLFSGNGDGDIVFTFSSISAVSEPGMFALFGLGIALIGAVRHRARRADK